MGTVMSEGGAPDRTSLGDRNPGTDANSTGSGYSVRTLDINGNHTPNSVASRCRSSVDCQLFPVAVPDSNGAIVIIYLLLVVSI